jgi:hypothetical protein
MIRFRTAMYAMMVLVILGPGDLSARALESWSYEKLLRASDLVVIAQVVTSADTGGCVRLKGWHVDFIGVNTDFKVSAVLKGKLKGDQLRVLHFRLPKNVLIENGPCLVAFRQKGMEINTKQAQIAFGKPSYLLFLTRRKDGRYEPVSGRVDPVLSVREMYRPLPAALDAKLQDKLSK